MSDIKFCPACGSFEVENQGAVFIEDGPYNGRQYANEGEYPRYQCARCKACFGFMPEPLLCACGERIAGELGVDCEVLDADTDHPRYLCEECMAKTTKGA
jgi:hypothetical protein